MSAARVSPETIDAQARGGLKAALVEALRHGKPRRRTFPGSAIILESLKIPHRPEELDARHVPDHWPFGDWRSIACRLAGRGSAQGGLQPLFRRHLGQAQDTAGNPPPKPSPRKSRTAAEVVRLELELTIP